MLKLVNLVFSCLSRGQLNCSLRALFISACWEKRGENEHFSVPQFVSSSDIIQTCSPIFLYLQNKISFVIASRFYLMLFKTSSLTLLILYQHLNFILILILVLALLLKANQQLPLDPLSCETVSQIQNLCLLSMTPSAIIHSRTRSSYFKKASSSSASASSSSSNLCLLIYSICCSHTQSASSRYDRIGSGAKWANLAVQNRMQLTWVVCCSTIQILPGCSLGWTLNSEPKKLMLKIEQQRPELAET